MLHSSFIHNLSGDEAILFHAVAETVFNRIGLTGSFKYYQMLDGKRLANIVRNISNLHDEYKLLAEQLAHKLEQHQY